MIIFGIIGWKNSGKTYFAQKIISGLTKLNLKVASIKHAHHEFDIDQPNTDSFLHRKAGSKQIIISSSKRWAKISEINQSDEKKLNELIKELDSPDVIIVEGFKKENHPKIEIISSNFDKAKFLFDKLENVVAIISDFKINAFDKNQFKRNQINEIIKFILNCKGE